MKQANREKEAIVQRSLSLLRQQGLIFSVDDPAVSFAFFAVTMNLGMPLD